MLLIFLSFGAGIAAGLILKRKRDSLKEERALLISVVAMIFFMGASIGSDPNIKEYAASIGLSSLLFAIFMGLGSAGGAYVLRRLMPR